MEGSVWSKLFPSACLLCKRAVVREIDLCETCEQSLPQLGSCCPRCALPLIHARDYCGFCLAKPWRYERCVCLFKHKPPITQLVAQFKYHQKLSVGRTLGILLAEKIKACYEPQSLPEVIVPLPLHNNRLRRRGFNQSMEIARVLSHRLNIALAPNLMMRKRDTPSQIKLSLYRRELNVRGAFARCGSEDIRSIAIVDDVLTSGASTIAAARSIKAGTQLHLWCLSRAVL